MSVSDLLARVGEWLAVVELAEGGVVVVRGCSGHHVPPALLEELRLHKSEVLDRLRWEEQADALILASTRRLAAAWPLGCPLDSAPWAALEEQLRVTYWEQDVERLATVLRERERHALPVFEHYRKECAA